MGQEMVMRAEVERPGPGLMKISGCAVLWEERVRVGS